MNENGHRANHVDRTDLEIVCKWIFINKQTVHISSKVVCAAVFHRSVHGKHTDIHNLNYLLRISKRDSTESRR